MRWAMVASASRNARAITSVVKPQIMRSASAARASRDRRGWQAVKIRRSNSSPISSSSAESKSGMISCSCARSCASMPCLCESTRLWRSWSSARRLAVAISHAPGFSGTPVTGQCSSAAINASWVRSSASGTSRSIRDRLVISRGCSIRHTARIVAWMSAAVIAADLISLGHESSAGGHLDLAAAVGVHGRKGTDLTGAFPARHMVPVELHELYGRSHRLFLVAELEDRVAADHLLGLDEGPVDDVELAV